MSSNPQGKNSAEEPQNRWWTYVDKLPIIGFISAGVLVVSFVLFGSVLSYLINLPPGISLFSSAGLLAVAVTLVAMTEDPEVRLARLWRYTNLAVAVVLYAVLWCLTCLQRWKLQVALCLVFTVPLVVFAVADIMERQRALPQVRQLLRDTSRFVNEVTLKPSRPGTLNDLIARYELLRPEADNVCADFSVIFAALDSIFVDPPPDDSPECKQCFPSQVKNGLSDLEGAAADPSTFDGRLVLLLRVRLLFHLSDQGKRMQYVLQAYEDLEKIKESVPPEFSRSMKPEEVPLRQLYNNSWGNILSSCAAKPRDYQAWSRTAVRGSNKMGPTDLWEEARRFYMLEILNSTGHSQHRAINNVADLELDRITMSAKRFMPNTTDSECRKPATNPPDEVRDGEDILRDRLDQLKLSLKEEPLPEAMVTACQICIRLAHSAARRVSATAEKPIVGEGPAANVGDKNETSLSTNVDSSEVQDLLNEAVFMLKMALAAGLDRTVLESSAGLEELTWLREGKGIQGLTESCRRTYEAARNEIEKLISGAPADENSASMTPAKSDQVPWDKKDRD